jgi:hypothetical protein
MQSHGLGNLRRNVYFNMSTSDHVTEYEDRPHIQGPRAYLDNLIAAFAVTLYYY